jgi:hypothetical protein
MQVVAEFLGDVTNRTWRLFVALRLSRRGDGEVGTESHAKHKLFIFSINSKNIGKFVVCYEQLYLLSNQNTSLSFYSCQIQVEQDLPEAIHGDSEEFGKAVLARRLVWGEKGNIGGGTSHLGIYFYLVPPRLLLCVSMEKCS